ncbi:manganese efflux pump [Candidatus Soleaferrea massiliensis]|uniref:manganese efflux pump n=1 Tax=Candidatus Soleaferrea massiliensis TaxID=1470354 RepID=UPI00058BF1CE|nr:manganese efflux pump [Candidatus Soleaferrea massiliensis]
MSDFLYCIVFALVNNLDNIGVRIAYSLKGIRISIGKNLWISVITFAISFLFAECGGFIGNYMNATIANIISMVFLCAIGIWMILSEYLPKREKKNKKHTNPLHIAQECELADADHSNHIDFKEATLLGVALSLNNVGGSLGGGLAGLNAFLIGILSAVISFLALLAGNYLSGVFSRFNLGRKASVIAGLALVAIGVKQLF